MSIVSLSHATKHAQTYDYAIPAFNVSSTTFVRAALKAAEIAQSAVIINVAEGHVRQGAYSWDSIAQYIRTEADKLSVPVVLNLDHGTSMDGIAHAIRNGFSSVMYDGSSLPYQENLENTRKVVEICKPLGISVEAELGSVGGPEESGAAGTVDRSLFTDPGLAAEFTEATGIDALAVAIGNVHGKYKGEPKLDFELLDTIQKSISVPTVSPWRLRYF